MSTDYHSRTDCPRTVGRREGWAVTTDMQRVTCPDCLAPAQPTDTARPWANCTGASDCPEEWHEHGCYADTGPETKCSDPADHRLCGAPTDTAREAAVVRFPSPTSDYERGFNACIDALAIRDRIEKSGGDGRALVTIDPEDRQQVMRLADLLATHGIAATFTPDATVSNLGVRAALRHLRDTP